jgi:7-carboxy-7-deazaguanine synthase
VTATATERAVLHRVAEVFGPTIQGEGALIGQPTVFVRFGGCDYRCAWCDSLHAVLPEHRPSWRKLTPTALLDAVWLLAAPPYWITLSGGNPALQNCHELLWRGQSLGYRFACETQGSIWPDWFTRLDHLVLSPKPPSSGETAPLALLRDKLGHGPTPPLDRCSLKVVVADEVDLAFAEQVREIAAYYHLPFYLQPCNLNVDPDADPALVLAASLDLYERLARQVMARGWSDVRVLPQLHVLLWGNRKGV